MYRLAVLVVIEAVEAEPEKHPGVIVRCIDIPETRIPVDEHLHRPVIEQVERFVRVKLHRLPRLTGGDPLEYDVERLLVCPDHIVGLCFVPFADDAGRRIVRRVLFDAHHAHVEQAVAGHRLLLLPLVADKIEISDPDVDRVRRVPEIAADEFNILRRRTSDLCFVISNRDPELVPENRGPVVRIDPPSADYLRIAKRHRVERELVLEVRIRLIEVSVVIDVLRVGITARGAVRVPFRPVDPVKCMRVGIDLGIVKRVIVAARVVRQARLR